MDFNEKARRLLEWSGRTMKEVADALAVPPTTVSNWLHTDAKPRRDKLQRFAGWAEREFDIPITCGDLTNTDVTLSWQGGRPAFQEKSVTDAGFEGRPRYISTGLEDLELCELPVLGRIPAGGLKDMEEETLGAQVVPKTWTGGIDGCFVLRVWGDSMLPTLRDGEPIVCDASRAAHPRDGQIVVARHEGETTVKEFLRQDTQILLVPHNRDYHTLSVRPDEIEITAVVVARWQSMPNV